ncbi:MAG: metallophosphoesterase [Myxococcales bacterium]|nr:metallophosphoesterase [Myxococcales bacterium]
MFWPRRRRYAVIAHVDGNAKALAAVLDDIDAQGVDEIICLGNLIGAGPDPATCVDLAFERDIAIVRGCHEEVLFGGAEPHPARLCCSYEWPGLVAGLERSRELLRAAGGDRWRRYRALPERLTRRSLVFVHGTLDDPIGGGFDLGKPSGILTGFGRFLFCSHHSAGSPWGALIGPAGRHLPQLDPNAIDWGHPDRPAFGAWSPEQLGWRIEVRGKAIVMPGAVGRVEGPRPGARYVPGQADLVSGARHEARYVLAQGRTITWRQVHYGPATG